MRFLENQGIGYCCLLPPLAAQAYTLPTHQHYLTIPNWQIFPTILKLLKKRDENAPS